MNNNITLFKVLVYVSFLAVCQLTYAKGNAQKNSKDFSTEIHYHELLPKISLKPDPGSSGTWTCSLAAFDWEFELVLESNERLISELPSAKKKKLLKGCKLYRGHIDGITDSWVRLTKTKKKWSGMIWDGKELYLLDPAKSVRHSLMSPPRPRASDNVIYKLSDVIDSNPKTCDVGPTDANANGTFDYKPFVDELRNLIPEEAAGASLNLDMAVVTDPQFTQIQEGTFGTPTAAAVAARINVVDGIYSEQVGVQISLVDVIELANNGPLTSTHAGTLLNQFSNFSESGGFDNPGIGHLFTGRNLNGSTIGIAFIDALCSQRFGVGVDEIRNGGTSGALLVAHELGHNFGAPHDNQGGPCSNTPGTFIMNPSLNGSDEFSQCSVNQMQPTINNASCLTVIDGNQAPIVTINSPEDSAFVSAGAEINFVGSATDPEDGDLGDDISWSSDLDGSLGTGTTISVILSEGNHLITASVIDSDGLDATDSITIAVVDQGGVAIIDSNFNVGQGGFDFTDDTFRNTAQPNFADGNRVANGGFSGGGLQVLLGGINNADILGMSGGWEQTFTLDSDQEVTMTFRYNLTQAPNYEADEFSQALLAIDGALVNADGNDFLAQITGNGNGGPEQTTGWVPIGISLGTLAAGDHTITIGAFNNKKTFNDESTDFRIDDVTVRAESGSTPPPVPEPEIISENHFDADTDGFEFEVDAFRNTDNPDFVSGSHLPDGGFSGGGLQVLLGNINNDDILDMSGGWSQSFTVDEAQEVTLSFRYNLTQDSDYESDEFSEVLVMVDDTLISPDTDSSLIRLTGNGNGGPDQTTDWVLVNLNVGVLTPGDIHALTIGGFNNKKTFNNELTELLIDDVVLQGQ